MCRPIGLCSVLLATVLLLGQNQPAPPEPAWQQKPVSRWTPDDAKQLLTDSPWVKQITPQIVRDLSPDERRAGGDLQADRGKGVGLAIFEIWNPQAQADAIARAHYKPTPDAVTIRWESAMPVRAAEQKAGETAAPEMDEDHYAIVVYDILTPKQYNLAHELRGISYIKRESAKTIKPSKVEILRQPDGKATLVYFFPRSVEITKKDGRLEFVAQIGRLFIAQFFYTFQMQFQGQLEL